MFSGFVSCTLTWKQLPRLYSDLTFQQKIGHFIVADLLNGTTDEIDQRYCRSVLMACIKTLQENYTPGLSEDSKAAYKEFYHMSPTIKIPAWATHMTTNYRGNILLCDANDDYRREIFRIDDMLGLL